MTTITIMLVIRASETAEGIPENHCQSRAKKGNEKDFSSDRVARDYRDTNQGVTGEL